MVPRKYARILLIAAVVLSLAVGAQLAYTDVGRELGGDWSEPTELATLSESAATDVPAVAAAGPSNGTGAASGGDAADGSADGQAPSVVAWVERDADGYRVELAGLERIDGDVVVTGTRTLLRTDAELRDVDVAVRGDRLAVGVEDADADEVLLWQGPASVVAGDANAATEAAETGDGSFRRVSVAGTTRAEYVDVALLPNRTAVAWRTYEDGGFVGRVAFVDGTASAGDDGTTDGNASIDRRAIPGATTGRNAPAIDAEPNGDLAVAWGNASTTGVYLAVVDSTGSGPITGERVGDARSGASSLGSTNRPPVIDVAAGATGGSGGTGSADGEGNGAAPVLAWTDLSIVQVGASGDEAASFGSGGQLRIVGDAGAWTATWTESDPTSGLDFVFARSPAGTDAVETGHVSRLSSNALTGAPFALADRPAVVWLERGGNYRLLAAGYTGAGETGSVTRLADSPTRFGFVAAVSAVLAVVTVPLLPWVAGPLLLGFLLTTRAALSTLGRFVAGLARVGGRDVDATQVRSAVQSAPPWVGFAAFAVVNVALFRYLGGGASVPGIPGAAPFGISALGLVAALAVARLRGTSNPWKLSFIFGYCQSVALWATATPAFL
ncbi:hypothetical protein [Haloparvum sp. PAK95]|uniref:hypothetical protein n=1 Tax=Haloparvum sp. PAK95 TaxID=3418962 RepID=UPI003D2EA01C